MDQKWLDALSNCLLFDGVTNEDLPGILQCMNVRIAEYKKNDHLAQSGQEFLQVGVVLGGSIALTKDTISGNRVLINLLGPGEIFGEMAAYSGEKSWPVTVIAQTNCTVMFFSEAKIAGCCERVCVSHKKLILNMLKIVSIRAMMLNKKVEYLSLKSLREKIATYLLEEFQKTGKNTFQLELNRNELADFINVSRPSLSRELCRMRDEGLIDFFSSSIKIKDMEVLKNIVG